ncbi:MAG: hypothetical protein HY652_07095 [Acidobacteria bacterium]|nr:hypothetical protein [Acidobacteriota bacterium]
MREYGLACEIHEVRNELALCCALLSRRLSARERKVLEECLLLSYRCLCFGRQGRRRCELPCSLKDHVGGLRAIVRRNETPPLLLLERIREDLRLLEQMLAEAPLSEMQLAFSSGRSI